MATVRKVEVAIVGDASGVSRAFRQGEQAASSFGRRGGKLGAVGMGMLAGAAAGVTVAVGQGLVSAFRTGISEFAEAEKMSAQTAAAIKSTGGAAGVTVGHIENMASALQRQTGLQDDAIQGAQNLLLTFTQISNRGPDKIFDRATRATADLSVALGKDMSGSAMMVGKALNDPVRGVTALGRAGVQFSASQRETIKQLVETGRTADAQKMILKELETQVGGSAKAFGETTPGQVAKAQRAFEDMTQGIVTAAAPLAAAVLPGLTAAINGVTSFFQANWPKIQAVAQSVWAWFSANLLPTFRSIGTSIGQIVVAIVGIFRTYWPQIVSVVGPIVRMFGGIVKSTFATIESVLKVISGLLRGDFRAAWDGLKGIGSAVLSGIVSIIRGVPVALWNAAKGILSAALRLGKEVVTKIAEGIGSMPGLIKQGLSRLFGLAGDAGAINPYLSQITGAGAKVPEAVAKGINSGKGKVSTAFSSMTGGAANNAKGSAGTQANSLGSSLGQGIASGIRSQGPQISGAIRQVIRDGISAGQDEQQSKSPSRVADQKLGAPISQGMAQGIQREQAKPKAAIVKVVNATMKAAVASAKSNAISMAGSLASMFAQARTAGDSGRLAGLEGSLAADQATRQEEALKRAKLEAEAEENAKLAAKAGAENATVAEKEYQDAKQARLDAEAQLSDFYRQREIENLRNDITTRQGQYETDINNLAAQFGRGEISAQQFSDSLTALIGGERGAALGSAFSLQFELALEGLKKQLKEIQAIGGSQGVGASGPGTENPMETWRQAIENVRRSLESQWDGMGEAWKKSNPKAKWVNNKLNAWKRNAAPRYGVALAKGGIVTKATMALMGEAGSEAVLPLEGPRAKRMLRGSGMGGTVVNLTFNGVLDAREAARVLQPELNRLVQAAY